MKINPNNFSKKSIEQTFGYKLKQQIYKISYLLLALFSTSAVYAQNGRLLGLIQNTDGRALPNVTVQLQDNKKLQTDPSGRFFVTLPIGPQRIQLSSIGYSKLDTTLTILDNDSISLTLVLKVQNELKEVVVSASRRVEYLDEVPSSVTILSSKQLETQRSISNNLSDILASTVPGLGFSTNRTQNLGQTLRGRRVLIMIDGIPQSTPLRDGARDIRALDPSVIERVEVIKGATAIYGNGADGGLINYITKHANQNKTLSGSTELGSNLSLVKPEQTGGFYVSQQFSGHDGPWDYVLSGRYEQSGLYRDAKGEVLSPEYGMNDLRNWNAFTKIGYTINANNRLEMMYNFFKSTQYTDYIAKAGKYGDFNSPTTGLYGTRPGSPEGTPYNHNASLKYISHKLFGKTDLEANIYFQDYQTLINYSNFFENEGQPATKSKKVGLRLNFDTPYQFSNQISGNLTYGFDVLSDGTNTTLTDDRTVIPNMDMRNLAPYLQLKTILGQHLIFKAGSRLENVHINVPTYTTIGILNVVSGTYVGGGTVVKEGELNFSAMMFNAGLRYTKIDIFKPFVSFSQSFSVADLGLVLRAAKENTVTNTSIKAVKANNYEFGFSGDVGRLSYEAATYYSTSTLGASYIFVDGSPQIARSPENIYGFEVTANYRAHKILDLGASYSFTEGKRELTDASKIYLGGDRINPPKLTAYAHIRPLATWSLTPQMISTSGRERFDPVNGLYSYGTGPIKSFTIFNLSTSYQYDSKNAIRIGIENLFNSNYYSVISQWQSNNMNYVKGNGTRMNISITHSF
jgi:iron complex outermembrane receptor protein